LTYGNRGTAKPGVDAEDHAIIYTGSEIPRELPGEPKLLKKPIRVKLNSRREKLRPESRINFAKIYTVEHNVKVSFIGEIHEDSESNFFADFKHTLEEEE
jgi:hypothetical protein